MSCIKVIFICNFGAYQLNVGQPAGPWTEIEKNPELRFIVPYGVSVGGTSIYVVNGGLWDTTGGHPRLTVKYEVLAT